jgi:hypothetical protein
MKPIRLPQFSAEASLTRSVGTDWASTSRGIGKGAQVLPQMRPLGGWVHRLGDSGFCVIGVHDEESRSSRYAIVRC